MRIKHNKSIIYHSRGLTNNPTEQKTKAPRGPLSAPTPSQGPPSAGNSPSFRGPESVNRVNFPYPLRAIWPIPKARLRMRETKVPNDRAPLHVAGRSI